MPTTRLDATTAPVAPVTPPVSADPQVGQAATPTSAPAQAAQAPAAVYDGSGPGSGVVAPGPKATLSAGAATVLAARVAALSKDPQAVQKLTQKLADPAQLEIAIKAVQATLGELDLAHVKAAADNLNPKTKARLLKSIPGIEKALLAQLVELSVAGKLEEALMPIALPALAKLQPNATDAEKVNMVKQLTKMTEIQLAAHGMTPASAGTKYESWEELGKKHLAMARAEQASIDDPGFQAQLEKILGVSFVPGTAQLLINGEESFALRDKVIDNAKSSIQLMTWAVYNDATGKETVEKLKAAMARGVAVQVLVDDEVANEPLHAAMLQTIKDAGIPTVRVPGHHRKIMVVDGEIAIMGGLNIGDAYSHRGAAATDPKLQWRDTDIAIRGKEAVAEAFGIIKTIWDSLAPAQVPTLPSLPVPTFKEDAPGKELVAVVNDNAGTRDKDPIFVGILKGILSTPPGEYVDIENAYFILNPALQEALAEALKRGVKVRILSNSPESVDVPMISQPIVQSLRAMAELGAEVYLKKGSTLHSKFMVCGKRLWSVGSFNLHPQSIKGKGETNEFALSEGNATALRAQFEKDIAVATKMDLTAYPPMPETPVNRLVNLLFYDFL